MSLSNYPHLALRHANSTFLPIPGAEIHSLTCPLESHKASWSLGKGAALAAFDFVQKGSGDKLPTLCPRGILPLSSSLLCRTESETNLCFAHILLHSPLRSQ